MENNLLIGFSRAVVESCGYALLVYLALKPVQLIVTSANARYWLSYSVLVLLFGHFIFSIYHALTADVVTVAGFDAGAAISVSPETGYMEWIAEAEAVIAQYAWAICISYLFGFFVQLIMLLVGIKRVLSLTNTNIYVENTLWPNLLNALSERTGARNVKLHFSDKITVPSTIGFLKPIILVPLAAVNHLSTEQAEAILLHELAHIRRSDYLFNLLQRVMEMILFFNPVVWLLSRDIRKEREFCCDDLVMNQLAEPLNYANALLLLAEASTPGYSLAMGAAGSSKYPLLNRIKRLMTMKTSKTSPQQKGITLLMILAIGFSLAFAVPSRNQELVSAEKIKTSTPVHYKSSLVNLEAVKTTKHLAKLKAPEKVRALTHLRQDTTKKKISIVVTDEKGIKREYNTLEEIPVEIRKEFIQQNGNVLHGDTLSSEQLKQIKENAELIRKQFSSPEWKAQQAEIQKRALEMSKHFNSVDWKNQHAAVKKQADLMRKKMNSPEWKSQQEKMLKRMNSPEWKSVQDEMRKNGEQMAQYFNSAEWKKQQAELQRSTDELVKHFHSQEWKNAQAELQRSALEMTKQFNSPEWKKQIEALKEFNKKMIVKPDSTIKK